MAPAIAVVSPKKLAFYANLGKITTVADAIFYAFMLSQKSKSTFPFLPDCSKSAIACLNCINE